MANIKNSEALAKLRGRLGLKSKPLDKPAAEIIVHPVDLTPIVDQPGEPIVLHAENIDVGGESVPANLANEIDREVGSGIANSLRGFDFAVLTSGKSDEVIGAEIEARSREKKSNDDLVAFNSVVEEYLDKPKEKEAALKKLIEAGNMYALASQMEITKNLSARITSEMQKGGQEIYDNETTLPIAPTSYKDGSRAFLGARLSFRGLLEKTRFFAVSEVAVILLGGNSAKNAVYSYLLEAGFTEGLSSKIAYVVAGTFAASAFKFRYEWKESAKRGGSLKGIYGDWRNFVHTFAALTLAAFTVKAVENAGVQSYNLSNYGNKIIEAVETVNKQIVGVPGSITAYLENLKTKIATIKTAETAPEPDPKKRIDGAGGSGAVGYGKRAANKDFLLTGTFVPFDKAKNDLAVTKVKPYTISQSVNEFRTSRGLKEGMSLNDRVGELFLKSGVNEAFKELTDELKKLNESKKDTEKSFYTLLWENVFETSTDPTKLPRQVKITIEKVKQLVSKYESFKQEADKLVSDFGGEGMRLAEAANENIVLESPNITVDTTSLENLPKAPEFSLNIFKTDENGKKAIAKLTRDITGIESINESHAIFIGIAFYLLWIFLENGSTKSLAGLYRNRYNRSFRELYSRSVEGKKGELSLSRLEDLNYREQIVASVIANILIKTSDSIQVEAGTNLQILTNNHAELVERIRYKIRKSWIAREEKRRKGFLKIGLMKIFGKIAEKVDAKVFTPDFVRDFNSYLEYVNDFDDKARKPEFILEFMKDIEPKYCELVKTINLYSKGNPNKSFLSRLKNLKETFTNSRLIAIQSQAEFMLEQLMAKTLLMQKLEEEMSEEDSEFIEKGGEIVNFGAGISKQDFYAKVHESIARLNYASLMEENSQQEIKLQDTIKRGLTPFIRQLKAKSTPDGKFTKKNIPPVLVENFHEKLGKEKLSAQSALLDSQMQSSKDLKTYPRIELEQFVGRLFYLNTEVFPSIKPVRNFSVVYDSKEKRICLKCDNKTIKVPDITNLNFSNEEYADKLKAVVQAIT
jgi:hypothetical protein